MMMMTFLKLGRGLHAVTKYSLPLKKNSEREYGERECRGVRIALEM